MRHGRRCSKGQVGAANPVLVVRVSVEPALRTVENDDEVVGGCRGCQSGEHGGYAASLRTDATGSGAARLWTLHFAVACEVGQHVASQFRGEDLVADAERNTPE